jgi:hypothetical protein
MRQLYILLIVFLFFFTQNGFAQLTNGTKIIGGYASMSTYLSKDRSTYSNTTIVSRLADKSLSFVPSYGYFKNKFLIGGSMTGSTQWRNYKSDNGMKTATESYQNLGFSINPSLSYYTLNNKKFAQFMFINAGISSSFHHETVNNTSSKKNKFDWTWMAGVGGHKVLAEDFIAEGTVSYNKNKIIALSANLRRFYQKFDKKNQEAPPQYIAKNRWQVAGGFYVNYNLDQKNTYISGSVFGGKMVSNHFMLGGDLNASTDLPTSSKSSYSRISTNPFVRYYIPISNRFYAFPFIGSSIYADKNGGYKKSFYAEFNRGLGFQYFLNRNLALTCFSNGKIRVNKNGDSYTNANGGLTIGLSYFAK